MKSVNLRQIHCHPFAKMPLLLLAGLTLSGLAGCSQTGSLAQLQRDLAPTTTSSIKPAAARSARSTADLRAATAYWGQQFNKNPRDPRAAVNYARNLRAMKQPKKALTVMAVARQYHPNDRQIASEFGRMALATGHTKVAGKVLALASNPTDWKLISAKGTLAARKGDYKSAQGYYQRALAIAPRQASVMNNLALALALDGQAARAEPIMRKAVLLKPDNKRLRQNLAIILGIQGKFDEAEAETGRALPPQLARANAAYLRKMFRLPPATKGNRQNLILRDASSWNVQITTNR